MRTALLCVSMLLGCASQSIRTTIDNAERMSQAMTISGQAAFTASCRRIARQCHAADDTPCNALRECQTRLSDFVDVCLAVDAVIQLARVTHEAGDAAKSAAYAADANRMLGYLVEASKWALEK